MLFVGRLENRGTDVKQVVYQDGKVIWVGPHPVTEGDKGSATSMAITVLRVVIGCGVQEGAAMQYWKECLEPWEGFWSWTSPEVLNWWNGAFPPDKPGKVVDKKWR